MSAPAATLDRSSNATPASARSSRIASVDIVRGAVMVLMALDHVRVYSGLPAGGPTPGIFFTRWVTHFCAPAFVFLAGTSAFLYGRTVAKPTLSRFLLVRGVWLIFLELVVVRLFWTFNLQVTTLLAGVIWAIGWSMIVLALLVRFPLWFATAFGLGMVSLHNLADLVREGADRLPASGPGWLWQVLYFGGPIGGDNEPVLFVLYSIVPWAGVMAAGYAFGAILTMDQERARRLCLRIGIGATLLFVMLRLINRYGNPYPWGTGALSFLNPSKYPASLDFLLMTLGPTIALIPLLEQARGVVARVLTVFGRVPLFYYLLHIPLIHGMAIVVAALRQGGVTPWLFGNHPAMIGPPPDGYTWSLGLLYLVWAFAVLLLYYPSRWFARLKAKSPAGWLKFL